MIGRCQRLAQPGLVGHIVNEPALPQCLQGVSHGRLLRRSVMRNDVMRDELRRVPYASRITFTHHANRPRPAKDGGGRGTTFDRGDLTVAALAGALRRPGPLTGAGRPGLLRATRFGWQLGRVFHEDARRGLAPAARSLVDATPSLLVLRHSLWADSAAEAVAALTSASFYAVAQRLARPTTLGSKRRPSSSLPQGDADAASTSPPPLSSWT